MKGITFWYWFFSTEFFMSQNIVKFMCYRYNCFILYTDGVLLTYLRKHGKNLSQKQQTKMCEDVASGMAYLESKNCIHRLTHCTGLNQGD